MARSSRHAPLHSPPWPTRARRRSGATAVALALASLWVTGGALAGTAHAAAMLICHVGGPGTTSQAQGGVDKFLRQAEASAGLDAGSLEGEYHTNWSGCRAYLDAKKPPLVVFDLATYLKHAPALKLEPFAHMGGADAVRYHVVVPKGGAKDGDLAALAGKRLLSPLAADPRFLANVVLDGKVAADHFTFKHTKRPLKGLRNVSRGKADVTVVDHEAYSRLASLRLDTPLVSVFQSAGLPGLTLASVSAHKDAALVAKFTAALPKLCAGEGKDLCKTFGITAFNKADASLYAGLVAKYLR